MDQTTTIQKAVCRLLKPLVRMLIRFGVTYGIYAELGKRIYVEVAMEELATPGRKPSKSKAAVLTGLTRKEIARVQALPAMPDDQFGERHNRAVRVVTEWLRNEDYTDEAGAPRTLPVDGDNGSFTSLVKRYGGDIPVRAMLDELVRLGIVERRGWGEVGLARPGYIPALGEEEKLRLMGDDVGDLISTIDHNLANTGPETRFHMKVAYNNLPGNRLPSFRAFTSNKALELLKALDRELSVLDRDVNPGSDGDGRVRAGVAVYYFEEDFQPADSGETT